MYFFSFSSVIFSLGFFDWRLAETNLFLIWLILLTKNGTLLKSKELRIEKHGEGHGEKREIVE